MAELAVILVVEDDEEYLAATLESILATNDILLEVIVVDNASIDSSVNIVTNFQDKRIILIKNSQSQSLLACYRQAIKATTSPFLSFVSPADLVLPGIFHKMINLLKESPAADLVLCHCFIISETGKMFSERKKIRKAAADVAEKTDEQILENLVLRGLSRLNLPVCRREIFQDVSGLAGKFTSAFKLSLVLHMASRKRIRCLPEFGYIRRGFYRGKHQYEFFWSLVNWGRVLRICYRLGRERQFLPFPGGNAGIAWLLGIKLYRIFRDSPVGNFIALPYLPYRRARRHWWRKTWPYLKNVFFQLLAILFRIRQSSQKIVGVSSRGTEKKDVAYFIPLFPKLSETFIQREVKALRKSGQRLLVFAEAAHGTGKYTPELIALMNASEYLVPRDEAKFREYRHYFLRHHPLRYIATRLFVFSTRFEIHKSAWKDQEIFEKAIYLAGKLRENGINHIHSPWANWPAFVALAAARLLNITFSVQGRAFDLHRKTVAFALREKFDQASFVVTNSEYNAEYIRGIISGDGTDKVYRIYNGIEISRFLPLIQQVKQKSARAQLLSVGRLIEAKGFIYLLQACKALRDLGYDFRCTIIGEKSKYHDMNSYLDLRRYYHKTNLDSHVTFLGAKPFAEVLRIYENADIFVLPCIPSDSGVKDITPNVLIEAMAMSLPVISSTQTAIPEIVDDNINGLLVPPRDVQALTDAIIRLIENPELRIEFGKKARRKIMDRFDIGKNIQQYAGLFANSRNE